MSLTLSRSPDNRSRCHGAGRLLESRVHADDENIRIEDLVRCTRFLGLPLT
ncbi:MAG: hypothetical protein J7J03_00685 [Methanosarcinales archaeon]|nr:hypothetical protein [Methanosarcinales archaeon]